MPTYDYRCPNGHDFEHFYRKISDAIGEMPCPQCGAVAARRMSAGAGLVFKGSGFYLTDYGKNAHRTTGSAGADTGSESKADSKSESSSGSDSKASTSAESAKSDGSGAKAKSEGASTSAAKSDASKSSDASSSTKPKSGESK